MTAAPIIDAYAGPRGWSEGLRALGLADIGIEWDRDACLTAVAAGHRTIRADLTYPPPRHLAGRCAFIASPPYGVPQTRRRAVLMASREHPVTAPTPTHAETPGMFGEAPWVTMADALGWAPDTELGFPRIDDTGTSPDGYRVRDRRTADRPAFALTEKSRSWAVRLNPGRTDSQPNRRTYGPDEPAPTIAFGHAASSWVWERPATTVCGDPRLAPPGHRDRAGGEPQFGPDTIRLALTEALVLQSFRPDYPLAGTKTSRFQQVGNAVPPLLAPLTGHTLKAAA